MRKYEIYTDSFEIKFGRLESSIPATDAETVFRWYLNELDDNRRLRASFETLEEAQAEFGKAYSDYGRTYPTRGVASWLLCGELAWIEENEYTDDGDFDQNIAYHDVSAQGYASANDKDE